MKQKKNKPTLKEVVGLIGILANQVEQLKMQIWNGDRALDLYLEMKGDKEDFKKFLEEKFPIDDKDNKKTEEK
jgi:hypothetical protein|tara:strand:+ start:1117 stop:1335 length:219 start_codon:yes stop_codon:yes gene_type:complete